MLCITIALDWRNLVVASEYSTLCGEQDILSHLPLAQSRTNS